MLEKLFQKLNLTKTPKTVRDVVQGISLFVFFLLTFGLGPTSMFGLSEIIQEMTTYYFAVTLYFLDYALIAAIPFVGMVYNATRTKFKLSTLILDTLTIFFSTLLTFGFGLYILKFIGKPSSPFIPQTLLAEPIFIYSAFSIGVGLWLPFLLLRVLKK